jgi:hypothetical protein
MKQILQRASIASVLVVAASIAGSRANDQTAPLPSGWRVGHAAPASSTAATAVILWPSDSVPFESESRVMIVSPPEPRFVALSGKAHHLAFSPSGAHLIVHHEGPDGPKATLIVVSSGAIAWTKGDPGRRALQFVFATTGRTIAAVPRRSEWGAAGDTIEVFNLDGSIRRRIRLETTFTDVVIPDDGSTAVVALSRSLMSLRFGSTIETEWSRDFPHPEEPFIELRSLGGGRTVLRQASGYWKLLDADGTILYRFDPSALDEKDPARSLVDYSNYEPVPVPLPDRILLFNGTTDALLLNPSTGALSSYPLNLAVPTGFKRIGGIEASKIVFASSTEILIRSLRF